MLQWRLTVTNIHVVPYRWQPKPYLQAAALLYGHTLTLQQAFELCLG